MMAQKSVLLVLVAVHVAGNRGFAQQAIPLPSSYLRWMEEAEQKQAVQHAPSEPDGKSRHARTHLPAAVARPDVVALRYRSQADAKRFDALPPSHATVGNVVGDIASRLPAFPSNVDRFVIDETQIRDVLFQLGNTPLGISTDATIVRAPFNVIPATVKSDGGLRPDPESEIRQVSGESPMRAVGLAALRKPLAERVQQDGQTSDDEFARGLRLAVTASEIEDSVVFEVDLPGVAEGDLHVAVKDYLVTISGERKAKSDAEPQVASQRYGGFRRTIALNDSLDPLSVTAELEHGVLVIQVDRKAEVQLRRIPVVVK